MASPSALAAVLDEQPPQRNLFGVGQRPTFSSLYPTVGMNTPPLPSYDQRSAEQKAALIEEMFPDLAPTQLVKGVVGAVGDRLMQANQAMPWGGNDPQAIGYDPAAGTIDPSVMVPFATDVAGMATTGALAAPPVSGAAGMGIRAYHGSPHDFDRFSMDKIGTGEGAQAYGHGLYFAENPAVAGDYRKALTDNRGGGGPKMVTSYDVDGKHIPQSSPDWAVADVANTMREHGINPASPDGSAWLDDELGARYMSGAVKDTDAARAKVLDFYKAGEFKQDRAAGRMYEVDINASPDEFLDWDKPLSEQPPKVREAVKASYGDIRPVRLRDGSYSVTRVRPDGSGDTIWDVKAATADEALAQFDDWLAAASGRDVYEQVAKGLDITPGSEQGAATGNFRNAGIKGIRYKDAGSRGTDAAGGTSNFVVFSDDIVSILKKYGIAGLMAGGAGAALLGDPEGASAAAPSYRTGGRF